MLCMNYASDRVLHIYFNAMENTRKMIK